MRKLAIWVSPPYANNELFRPASPLNRDQCLAPYHALKTALEEAGGICETHDAFLRDGREPTDVLFLDLPKSKVSELLVGWPAARAHLLIQECEVVQPRNWNLDLHHQFDSIFSWSPLFEISNEQPSKYSLVNFSQKLFPPAPGPNFESRKLCTMIAGNKGSYHPLELYSKREEAIQFFEKSYPDDFDLYGVGWDQVKQVGFIFRVIKRIKWLSRLFAPKHPSYRGRVEEKNQTLRSYKFAICFENAQKIPGYITEKLFDCLMAGCVPIYWGAPDIPEHVPAACFIDFRKFKNYEELKTHMDSWTNADHERFLAATAAFLSSDKAKPFTDDYFASTIAKRVLDSPSRR